MLDFREAENVQKLFGSTAVQIRRDHAISHVLAALASARAEVIFFGGTALSRTFLTQGRLSEDIDLYSQDRQKLSQELDQLPDLIAQEFPAAFWELLPSQITESNGALLVCDASVQIKVQVLDPRSRGWQKIPTKLATIHQRYSDAPITRLEVPTFDGFVAMKVLAWFERGTPRDLFDLESLSRVGAVTTEARNLISDLAGFDLTPGMLTRNISGLWHEELAHQTRLEISERECLTRLLDWWRVETSPK